MKDCRIKFPDIALKSENKLNLIVWGFSIPHRYITLKRVYAGIKQYYLLYT